MSRRVLLSCFTFQFSQSELLRAAVGRDALRTWSLSLVADTGRRCCGNAYRNYVDEHSPFSTQQGIKGAEFSKVLVVADDEEGTHFQFSYDKYFGLKALSKTDQTNMVEGKDTQVERTRRLFYVCCTRAMTDLAVVLFTPDVAAADPILRSMNIFPSDQIHTAASLEFG